MTPRKPWIAALFSILALGGGHLYVGRAARFFVAVSVLLSVWTILYFAGYLPTFAGFVVGQASLLLFFLFVPIDPALIARKTQSPLDAGT